MSIPFHHTSSTKEEINMFSRVNADLFKEELMMGNKDKKSDYSPVEEYINIEDLIDLPDADGVETIESTLDFSDETKFETSLDLRNEKTAKLSPLVDSVETENLLSDESHSSDAGAANVFCICCLQDKTQINTNTQQKE